MKKKLNLSRLKFTDFISEVPGKSAETVNGGGNNTVNYQPGGSPIQYESACNICGTELCNRTCNAWCKELYHYK